MLTSLKPSFFLGIDAGATHTDVALANESGYIIGRSLGEGANPHNFDLDTVYEHLIEAIRTAETEASKKGSFSENQPYKAVCIGMAGLDTPDDFKTVTAYFKEKLAKTEDINTNTLLFSNGGFIGLKSGTENNAGICLIAGTGSNCYGLARSGRTAKAGNWGYILGDQGSAFAIGQAILQEVMKEHDGRKAKSALTDKVLEYLKFKSANELIPWVYQSRIPVKEVASLSQLLKDNSLSSNLAFMHLVNQSADALLDAYDAVFHELNLSFEEKFPVVLVGGLFNLKSTFTDLVTRGIGVKTPKADIIIPKQSPAEGAIRIAMMGNYLNALPDVVVSINI